MEPLNRYELWWLTRRVEIARQIVSSGGGGTPTYTQQAFQFRNDNGSETTATFIGTLSSDQSLNSGATYRVRFRIQNTGAAAGTNWAPALQYNKNAAGWVNVTTTSANIKAVTNANGIAEGADITQQLGAGTYHADNNGFSNDGAAGGAVLDLAVSSFVELEYCFQIVDADVANNDSIQLQISGTTVSDTAVITVSKAGPTVCVAALAIANAVLQVGITA
jgi:hypothetical protein